MRKSADRYFYENDADTVNRFIEAIDWAPFHLYLQQLGVETPLKTELYTDAGKYRLRIRGSRNLADKTGIMVPCFESVYVQDFGTFLFQPVDYDEDLRTAAIAAGEYGKTWEDFDGHFGPVTLQVNIDLRYRQKKGGENGLRLFCAEYVQDKGWEFYPL